MDLHREIGGLHNQLLIELLAILLSTCESVHVKTLVSKSLKPNARLLLCLFRLLS